MFSPSGIPSGPTSAPDRLAKDASPKVLAVFRRAMFSIAVVVAVFWGFYHAIDPGYYDPLWIRGVLIAGGVVPGLLTYGRSWSLRAVAWTGTAYSLIMSSVLTWLGVRNGLDGPWALGICVGVIGSGLAIALYASSLRVLKALLAVLAAVNAAAALVAWTPEAHVGIFLGYLVTCTVAFYIAGASRIAIFRRYRESRNATRESEHLLQTLFDTIPDVLFVLNREGQFVLRNPAAIRTQGGLDKKADEGYRNVFAPKVAEAAFTEAQTHHDLFPPEVADTLRAEDLHLMETGESLVDVEYPFTTPDGEERMWSGTKVPIRGSDGTVTGLVCITHDVTEQKRAEAELVAAKEAAEARECEITEQKQLLQTLFDAIPDVLFVLNREGRFILRNAIAVQTHGGIGGTADEGHHDLFPPEVADALLAQDLRLMETGESLSDLEYPFTTPDGEKRMWSAKKVPLRATDGAVTGLVGIIRDVTEQKRAEAALVAAKEAAEARECKITEQKRLLQTLFDAIPDAIVVTDQEGRVLTLNEGALHAFRVENREDAAGMLPRDIFPRDAAETIRADDLAALNTDGPVHQTEYPIRLSEEQEMVLDVARVPLRDTDGRVEGLVVVASDITEQKRARAELVASKEDAEAATRAKSEFLANMSHEIRTPMNGVIGMTDLLTGTDLDAEQRDFVETIRTSGDALLTLINDILDFSKIEADRLDLEMQPFEIRTCVEEALDLTTPRAGEQQTELAYFIEDDVPHTVIGDITRVRQVLVNFLSNAVKFTEGGHVSVHVSAQPPGVEASGRCEIHFAVEDTGIGIPADKLGLIFESFSQADTSTTREHGGTGLGLAICQRLVTMMGGEIGVESEVGVGSRFAFSIDVEVSVGAEQEESQWGAEVLEGLRVLVVDDIATNRKIISRFGEKWEMEVTEAASGAEALRLVDADPYDLVLLDMQMPEMDGLAVAQRLARFDGAPKVVLLTSVYPSNSMHEELRRHGVVSVLYKPIKPQHLHDALLRVTGSRVPLEAPAIPEALPAASPADAAGPSGLRILLAEDNPINQKVALRMLERLGYRADVAATGTEVLTALRRQPYDLILMDVQMPEMDGLEATRRVRADFDPAEQPRIVALTANAMQGDRERCLDAGADDYLAKPVDAKQLAETLAQYKSHGVSLSLAETSSRGVSEADLKTVREHLAELIGEDDPNFARELADSYLANTPDLLDAIRAGIADDSPTAVRDGAHTLKSSSALFGFEDVMESCDALEMIARDGDLAGADEWLCTLERAFLDTQPSVHALTHESRPAAVGKEV